MIVYDPILGALKENGLPAGMSSGDIFYWTGTGVGTIPDGQAILQSFSKDTVVALAGVAPTDALISLVGTKKVLLSWRLADESGNVKLGESTFDYTGAALTESPSGMWNVGTPTVTPVFSLVGTDLAVTINNALGTDDLTLSYWIVRAG